MTERILIDESFYVDEKRYGLWDSYYPDGKPIITAGSEENCVRATRFYLKGLQEGWDADNSRSYDGVVGGKL